MMIVRGDAKRARIVGQSRELGAEVACRVTPAGVSIGPAVTLRSIARIHDDQAFPHTPMSDSTMTSGGPADVIAEPRRWGHGKLSAVSGAGRWGRLLWAALACLPVLAAPWVSRALYPRPSAFNSDLAIPVLMARAREWSLFDVYYWGQDRLGTWHLLLLRAAGQLSGHTFDYADLHLVAAAWVLAAATR
jgi:hypothetical protein